MKLIVGLGNPGPKYETTRHNAGFLMVDELVEHFGTGWSGEKFKAGYSKGRALGEDVVFLKPLTFMNLSGQSVAAAMGFFKIAEEELIVLHDDIDVPRGGVKARLGGGHGGHKGIKSIVKETGLKNFHRLKLGVGRPEQRSDGDVVNWVLGKLTDDVA